MYDQLTPVRSVPRAIRLWLFVGVVLVFFQVLIGGITRLTDSGLSITEWEVVKGTIPPLNEDQWMRAFEKYQREAKKQFESLHSQMTLSQFKVIYYWEYFHRLWARLMGLVFIIPFVFFLWRKQLEGWLLKRLGIVIALAMMAATFGWIMVASGLNDDSRTWVSAYKLVLHLIIASSLFGYLLWTWLMSRPKAPSDGHFQRLKQSAWIITAVLGIQFIFGGLMAGMRAALIHPYFPYFIEGENFIRALFADQSMDVKAIIDYEPNLSIKAWVQLLHRGTAYLLLILILQFFYRAVKLPLSKQLRTGVFLLLATVLVQFALGVLTMVNSIGQIPIIYGVLHQGVGLIVLGVILYVNYQFCSRVS